MIISFINKGLNFIRSVFGNEEEAVNQSIIKNDDEVVIEKVENSLQKNL
jgi:hypothetical protein